MTFAPFATFLPTWDEPGAAVLRLKPQKLPKSDDVWALRFSGIRTPEY